ncbi:UNVERIFIED_CONTAM: hypothetical protein RKD50_009390 [Streptomyces canus]
MNRSIAVSSWSGTGLPLWLIGLVVLMGLMARAGYLAAARTPVRTARQEADALLGRHVELALRSGITVGMATMLLCLTAQGSAQIEMSMMGSEMGGMTAGLHSAVRLSGLTGFVLAAVCAYGGSRLHALRTSRRAPGPLRSGPTASGGLSPGEFPGKQAEQVPRRLSAPPLRPGQGSPRSGGTVRSA